MKQFSISLASARVNAKLTQNEASKKLGISKPTLLNWENGRTEPKASDIKKICEVYGVPVELLDI